MNLIVILLVLILLFGGGGLYGWQNYGPQVGGGIWIVLLVLVVLLYMRGGF